MHLCEIRDALLYGDQHPVSLFAAARNPDTWKSIRENTFYKEALEDVIKAGNGFLSEPIRALRFSDYKIFDTTGSRKEYEDEYFHRRGRLNTLAILSLALEEDRYISALEDAIWAICDEYTWCLPAHLYGESLVVLKEPKGYEKQTLQRHKSIREHDRNVDLFASDTGHSLAEICSLLENRLSPLVVHRARELVKKRVLDSYSRINPAFWWETCNNNWAAVCAGAVGSAALYLIEDSSALAPVVLRVIHSLEAFLSGYENDGACTEGLGYWNYGFGFYATFAQLLRERTCGKIDLMQGEKIRQICLFQQKCYLSENKVVSFSDAKLTSQFYPGLTNYLKSRYEEVEIPELKYSCKFSDIRCHSWPSDIRNFVWASPDMASTGLSDASYYLKDAQWLVTRLNTGGSTAAFAAKGGHNGESHNHNDVGHFILHVNGESLLTDTGSGEYTKQYFGPERYSYLCNSSRGHSVPIIDGSYQQEGKEYSATVLEQSSTCDNEIFSMDIAKAYSDSNLLSLKRSFVFEKNRQPRLVLKDSYRFAKSPKAITERFVTFREPMLLAPGKAEIPGDSGSIILLYDADKLDFSVTKDIFYTPIAVPMDIYLMNLEVIKPELEFTVEVTFEILYRYPT